MEDCQRPKDCQRDRGGTQKGDFKIPTKNLRQSIDFRGSIPGIETEMAFETLSLVICGELGHLIPKTPRKDPRL
jgi:hypothetical protein